MRKSVILAGVLLMTPALSHAKTLEELLVEKGVITKGEAASSSGGGGSVAWNNGSRFSYPSEGVTTTVSTQLQERYTYTDFDEDSGQRNTSSFDTRRARIIVSGTALHEEFSYVLQTDFVGTEDDDGTKSPELRDAYFKWQTCDWMALKMGQFKTGVSRQFNTSSSKLQFVDRSVVSEYMDLDRQQGLGASLDPWDGQLLLGAAMFNGESTGEGRNRSGVDTRHTSVLNARWNALGKMDSYEEGDVNFTEDMAVSIGGAWAHSSQNLSTGEGDLFEEGDKDTVSVDANMKYEGWSIHAEYFYQNQDRDSFSDSVDASGFYAQIGTFLDPKVLEVALRYALLDCDDGQASGDCSGNDSLNQAAATINYYFWKHNLKAQLGYEFLNEDPADDGDDLNTNKWIFQLSAYL